MTREVGRVVDRIVAARAKAVIATSGTAAALAAVASHLQKGPKKRQPANVSRALMDRIAKLICRLPIEDRRKLQGIGPRRAEIIAAGALVYDLLLRREQELTVIAAMHELTLAGQYSDRLALLVEGRLVATGTAAEVLTESTISAHYGAEVRVIDLNGSGTAVIPVRR